MTGQFWGPAHERFRRKARRFVEREVRPHASAWERQGAFPRRALVRLGAAGLLTVDPLRNAVLAEEMPRGESSGFALSVFVQSTLIGPLVDALGTDAQKRDLLAPLLQGRRMGALAVTEPIAGSDVAALECRAESRRGGYLVNGMKTYITNAAVADFLVVAARSGATPGDLSLFVVPAATGGVRVDPLATLGLRTSAMGRITLRNVRLPPSSLLGEAGAALTYVQAALNRERLFGGLAAVAWAEHAWRRTAEFARSRRAFGRPLTKFQAIRHQFADMAASLEAARQLNYATFDAWRSGRDVTREICMIKLFTYQVVQDAIARCLQIHGGAGYLDDHWISRYYRDARALTIAAGTPEVMKDVIAAHLRL